ncbi:SEN34 subunit of tRNA-splicing endonuclease [Melanomma pulvis-pyrius CBS 109.77]|uniref:tRNA-splicing endonuclease subunit Sen34 n=1 Tax=Melanomma pulvis-pyrius CBS 109.77 TaxID=1314802 RepID=A0A6A6XB39_9PLEO|nr:SEN34 subunit of tRNA-splicing endonuclease [Melanomma pulvis-pyrius CBS 109.77]
MAPVAEPFPISHIAGRYLLFSVDAISHARRAHNICGVLIGTIPNLSQQNVFLGIPLELMPEEARVLVEQGHAYIVDEAEAHRAGFVEMSREDRLAYLQTMDQLGLEQAMAVKKKSEERSEKALKAKGLSRIVHERNLDARSETAESTTTKTSLDANSEASNDISLFDPPASPTVVVVPEKKLEPHFITPTTSYPPLPQLPVSSSLPLPEVAANYPLFRYLHSKGYFSMPGLRFGCHYSVYPGDPLRFHSHFLATGMGWDDEFDLLDIVGGGRLGTGVKKAYLIGGEDPDQIAGEESEDGATTEPVRAFSIEWAGL